MRHGHQELSGGKKRGILVIFQVITLTKTFPVPGTLGGAGPWLYLTSVLPRASALCLYTKDKVIWVLGAVKCSLAFIYNVLEHDVPREISCRRVPAAKNSRDRQPSSRNHGRAKSGSVFTLQLHEFATSFNRLNSIDTKQTPPTPRSNLTLRLSSYKSTCLK